MKVTTAALAALGLMAAQVGYSQAFTSSLSPPIATQADVSTVVQAQVPAATATTDSNGAFSASWSLASAPTTVVATIKNSAGNVYECPAVATATGVSGKCYQIVSNTLPTAAPALLGLVVSPLANPGAGLTATIIGKM